MILSKRAALAVAGVAAAAVVGTAGIAAATASAPSSPTSTSPSADPGSAGSGAPDVADRRAKPKHHLFGRGLHGEFVVKGKDGEYVTVVTVRGEVTAVSASAITIKAEDGFTATYAVTSETRVRGEDVDAIADVEVGDRAGAIGVKTGNTVTARVVGVRG